MGNKNTVPVTLFEKFIHQFNRKISLLEREIFTVDTSTVKSKTVFLSICNGKDRATVIHSSHDTLEGAWKSVVKKGEKLIQNSKLKPLWVKADVVTTTIVVSSELISKTISNYEHYFMRKGISFDKDFNSAYLETELNRNNIIDYKNKEINIPTLNNYQKRNGCEPLKSMPDKLLFFDCQAFLCDEHNKTCRLSAEEINYGTRPAHANYEEIQSVLTANTNFLRNSLQDDGKFTYGYHPISGKEISSYNLLRHTGTIWTLINQYALTKDDSLVPTIEKAIGYLTNNFIISKDESTSFLLELKSNELKLGGNGIAIIVLSTYMEIFNTNCFTELIIKLGNGILLMQDEKTGGYFHVLNYPDFSLKDQFRSIYYDGEATFALSKIYDHTHNKIWLKSALKAVDYFIENKYEKYADHWIAYSMNEITKHAPEIKYFQFGLKNAQVNMDKVYNRKTLVPTFMEMLMATFQMYNRIKMDNIKFEYINNIFDEAYFIETINKRATYMLNSFMYPEHAMYFKNPGKVLGGCFVRQHSFRLRIDDVQHFSGGYYLYLLNYNILADYNKSLIK